MNFWLKPKRFEGQQTECEKCLHCGKEQIDNNTVCIGCKLNDYMTQIKMDDFQRYFKGIFQIQKQDFIFCLDNYIKIEQNFITKPRLIV